MFYTIIKLLDCMTLKLSICICLWNVCSFCISKLLFYCFFPEMFYPLTLLVLLASATGDGNFRFTKTHIQVEEAPFTQAIYGISRTGSTSGIVDVTCKVGVAHFTLPQKQ